MRSLPLIRPLIGLLLTVLLASGCANAPRPMATGEMPDARTKACVQFFDGLERQLGAAGVLNAGAERIEGFPWLRADRFLAATADRALTPQAMVALVERMRRLDMTYREHEIRVLGPDDPAGVIDRSENCGRRLNEQLVRDEVLQRQLFAAMVVADEYVEARRVIGLFPLVRPFLAAGVRRWHEEARAAFSTLSPDASTWRYRPPERVVDAPAFPLAVDALGVPVLTDADADALFARHAPVWEVAASGPHDRIGSPVFRGSGPDVDIEQPVTFEWLSFTTFAGDVLAQLNYVVWFPARPRTGLLDLYSGRFDGVTFRVTLDTDGVPLVYESIHNCGCYYKVFPSDRLRARSDSEFAEPPLILPAPDLPAVHERLVVSMAAKTHYIEALFIEASPRPGAIQYETRPYASLFSLSADPGHASLFDGRGLIPESRRLERFLLWPSGVLSPGAMRQWGTHATAFIGERHFDDPTLLDTIFQRPERSGSDR